VCGKLDVQEVGKRKKQNVPNEAHWQYPEQNLMPLLGAGAILLVAGVAGLAAVFGPAGGCKPMER
jgi:hypothetical protein